ncbi:MAG: 2OG-Fe(II) oxygenase family protein [Pseudomonadota bacterium]
MELRKIDFSSAPPEELGAALDEAFRSSGFAALTGLPVPGALVQDAYHASRAFFDQDAAYKQRFRYRSSSENFGYQGMREENLDPGAPADLKETFTMRNVSLAPLGPERWPTPEYRALMVRFYEAMFDAGLTIARILAHALNVEVETFARQHSGENVTLRLLLYPSCDPGLPEVQQLGAGAHTDYGLLTLLLQDDVGGLQIRDRQGTWRDVPPDPETVLINCGDMLERWSNGRYLSTEHRVKVNTSGRSRMSIAMFMDPDSTTEITALPSCVSADNPARYPPITAGAHLAEKLNASHKDRYHQQS